MVINSITVSLSRKLPHPSADYASVSGFASITAEVSSFEDHAQCFAVLQQKVDAAVDTQLNGFMNSFQPKPRPANKAADATANTAADLAAKHAK